MSTNPLKGLFGGSGSDEEERSDEEEVGDSASSPFSVGTRVRDALVGQGVVKALPETADVHRPGRPGVCRL